MVSIKKSIFIAGFLLVNVFFGISSVHAQMPNDPFAKQWSYETADVYRAWEYTGKLNEVVVAVIDNGFDYTHPDLVSNLWVNKKEIQNNGIDDDLNGFVDDVNGWNFIDENNNPLPNVAEISDTSLISHGTVVAGIIGATGNNGLDGVGVSKMVKLMNLKVVDNVGTGLLATVVKAIYYAVDNGANVINMSLVGSGVAPEIRKAIQYAYEHGVTVVAAAGNNRSDLNVIPDFPVCSDAYDPYASVIGVSAIDQSRRLAVFSNIGSTCIDMTAPGVDVAGPVRYAPSKGFSVSYEQGWNGTSFAAPFVSAAAALIKSIQPLWNPDQITRTLFSTARHTPANDERAYRETYGKGLIQIGAAVDAAAVGKVPESRLFVAGEKDNSFTAPRRLIVNGNSGDTVYEMLGENSEVLHSMGIRDAEALTSFRDKNGNAYYAVIKPKNKTERFVSIYDYNWTRRFRWSFDAHGRNYEIAAADISGDSNKEIILVATDPGHEDIQVFHMDGTFIGNLSQNQVHLGATVAVANQTNELLYAYRSNVNTVVFARIIKGEARTTLFESPLKSLGGVSYLYDKNTNQELLVVGSGVGTTPSVNIFSHDGVLLHSFRPYSLSFRGGVKVLSILYGEDGLEQIVVIPKVGMYSMRIFDYTGSMYEDINIDPVLTNGRNVLATVAPF